MLFNSFEFALFFPLIFLIYWGCLKKSVRYQNVFLLVASYIFYSWWDYRFVSLLFISSLVDYVIGLKLEKETLKVKRKLYLFVSLAVNLSILGFFKYYNFFTQSLVELLTQFGLRPHFFTIQVILPVGISFYTFQTLTYSIDIYRGNLKPTHDPIAFFAYVSFFPQLVAGPIERATNLLPQFLKPRHLNGSQIQDGMRQILWGLFKKIVVADTVAVQVDYIFSSYHSMDGLSLLIGAFLFSIQIYCDFSGYSDIALGTARLLGFELMRNFAYPYFSRSIAEFWQRWHISLSSWFRDYLYIPLGGNRVSKNRKIFNILITFTVSGLWHGANWTFVIWGFLNGWYYILFPKPHKHSSEKGIVNQSPIVSNVRAFKEVALTFTVVLLGWVFFRSVTLIGAIEYIIRMFLYPYLGLHYDRYILSLLLSMGLLLFEWFQRKKGYALEIGDLPMVVRYTIYYAIFIFLVELGGTEAIPFIYFQF